MLARMRSVGSARRLSTGLILLALWLQALAPASALMDRARQARAQATAVDALIHAAICGRVQDRAVAADAPADPVVCDRCPFCRCTAAAPLPVVPDARVGCLVWQRITWPIPPPAHDVRPPRIAGRARAPPATV
ncbi:hypothetical protein ACLBX9_06955 [Methylobacterium sp. A49B]